MPTLSRYFKTNGLLLLIPALLGLSGCSTASKNIKSTYVSSLTYRGFDCSQLEAESRHIQTRVVELGGRLDEAAQRDRDLALGHPFIWPFLPFMLGRTKAEETEYSRLKGEFEAIQAAAAGKKCKDSEQPAT